MKNRLLPFASVLFAVIILVSGCGPKAAETPVKEKPVAAKSADSTESAPEEKVSYTQKELALQALGWSMGMQVMQQFHQVELTQEEMKQVMIGLEKVAADEPTPENLDVLLPIAQQIMQSKAQAVRQKMMAAAQDVAKVNIEKGKAFFAELEQKEGVKKTGSGLYYEILKEGSDKFATAKDTVKVHYHGTLIDGTVFDSSVERGEPTSFPLNGVIAGFSEGLQLVGEGGKIKLYIPSSLGYGNNPRPGGVIKPGDTLIFEVEMIEVIKSG